MSEHLYTCRTRTDPLAICDCKENPMTPIDELEKLRRDAARYNWLSNGGWEVMRDPKYWTLENGFDGAIDAGMMDVALQASQERAKRSASK